MRLYMSVNVTQVAHQLMGIAAVIFKLPAFPSPPFAATIAVFPKGVAASPTMMDGGGRYSFALRTPDNRCIARRFYAARFQRPFPMFFG